MTDTVRKYMDILNESPKERVDELDPFGGIAKGIDNVKAKLGSKEAKQTQVAKDNALQIWNKWEKDSIDGGVTATIENIGNWLNKEQIDTDVIDAAFRGIGFPNIKKSLRQSPQSDILPLQQWMQENNITPGSLNGVVLKDYLLDVDVKEEDIPKMLKDIGLKNTGSMLSKEQVKKVEPVVSNYKPSDAETAATAATGDTPTGEWSANDVYKHIMKNYEVNGDEVAQSFKKIGVKSVDEEIGDNRLRKILDTVEGNEKNMFTSADSEEEKTTTPTPNTENRMDATQTIMKDGGGGINKAISSGKKAINAGDFSAMTELQKLGIAILTARKKI